MSFQFVRILLLSCIKIARRLKERENLRRDEVVKLKKEGEIELQRIAREIEEEKEKEKAKVRRCSFFTHRYIYMYMFI